METQKLPKIFTVPTLEHGEISVGGISMISSVFFILIENRYLTYRLKRLKGGALVGGGELVFSVLSTVLLTANG